MRGTGAFLTGLAARVGGTAGSLAAGQVVVGLTYVLAARTITPSTLGLIATCYAVATVSAVVFDLGLGTQLLRQVSAGTLDHAAARAVARAKRRFVPLVTVPVVAVCTVLGPTPVVGAVLGAGSWLVWEAQTANAQLRARQRFARAAGNQLTGRVVGLGLTATLLVGPGTTTAALPAGLVVAFAIEAALDHLALGRSALPADHARMRTEQRRAVSLGLTMLSSVGQQLDTPVVAAAAGASTAGVYAAAGRLLGPLLFFSTALALVGLPWLSAAGDDPDARRAEERRVGRVSVVLAVAPLLAGACGPPVLPWLLGPEYGASGPTFAVLAVGAAFSTLNQGQALVLQNRRHDAVVARAIATGLVLGLIGSFVLARLGGPVWAAGGFTVSQLWILAALGRAVRQVRRGTTPGHPPPVDGPDNPGSHDRSTPRDGAP